MVLVRGDRELTSWPLPGCGRADLEVVEELARWQLAARRLGCSIRLRDASAELRDLVAFVGLGAALTDAVCLAVEVLGKAEEREQPGVEEVVVPDDAVP